MEKYCPRCFEEFDDSLAKCPDDGTTLVAALEENLVGQELDERYKILRKLGQGGMGVVYVAEQAMIGRQVALKVLRMEMARDKASVQRFLTEAKAIAALKSAHTITLHDFGITDKGLLYYTMELLEGRSLSDIIKQDGPIGHERAAGLMLQVLESLDEAHERDILHRDLKPDNIFITTVRGVEFATVLDFGIAKLVGDQTMETITRTGMICGTPAYLSPEQALGNTAVPASDLYSLGIVLYEMLAGIPPFYETTPMKVLLKHLNQRPEPIHVRNPKVKVPASLDAFLQKTLEKEPGDRFPSVDAFRRGLQAALFVHQVSPETVNLSGMATSQDGIRAITADYRPDITDSTAEPMSDTRDQRPGPPPTPDSTIAQFAPEGDQTPSSIPPTDSQATPRVATDGLADASPDSSSPATKPFPWRIVSPILALTFVLGFVVVWQPWLGGGGSDVPRGEVRESAEEKRNHPTDSPDRSTHEGATPLDALVDNGALHPAPDITDQSLSDDAMAVDGVGSQPETASGNMDVAPPLPDAREDVAGLLDASHADLHSGDAQGGKSETARMDLTATAEREPAVSTPQEKPVNREGRNRRLGKKSTGQKDARDSRETVPPKERESPAAEEADESPDSPGQSGSERMGFRNIEEEEPVPGDSEDKSGRQRMGFRPVEEE